MQSEDHHKHSRNVDAREATELHNYEDEHDIAVDRPNVPTPDDTVSPKVFSKWMKESTINFWKHQISVTVAPGKCRDHLGMLLLLLISLQIQAQKIMEQYSV